MASDQIQTTAEPVITGWFVAYSQWLPGALMDGHTNVNDAFRSGYLAAIRDIKEIPHAD